MRKLLVLLALLAAWWARCGAQESIRVDVNLVTVAFSVRDVSGGLVDNLTKDDFEVIEDAAPQKIAFFAKSVDVPLTLGLIVDASGSQEHFAKQHENDLKVFLKEALGPRDRAFLVGFGNHVRLVSDLSTSGEEMMESWRLYDKDSRHFPELGPKRIGTWARLFTIPFIIRSPRNLPAKMAGGRCCYSATGRTIPVRTT